MTVTSRSIFFFFNDTATTEIYTLSLHDALPISPCSAPAPLAGAAPCTRNPAPAPDAPPEGGARRRSTASDRSDPPQVDRSEEHTSELQSRQYLVCRLLLEKKKKKQQSSNNRNKK